MHNFLSCRFLRFLTVRLLFEFRIPLRAELAFGCVDELVVAGETACDEKRLGHITPVVVLNSDPSTC